MIGAITHSDIVQKADHALELEEHAHHRVNLAGVHIDENPPHAKTFHIEMPTNLDPETITGIGIQVVHIPRAILSDDELVAFLQFRDYLTLIATAAAASRTSKETKHQFTCGSGSCIVSMLHAHHAPRRGWTESQSRCSFIRQEQARNTPWSNPVNQFMKSINAQNLTKF
jgi:hypothetical protein